MAPMTPAPTSYATLSPDMVLDALDSVGLRSDGRLLALNSYENRVYQVAMEEGAPLPGQIDDHEAKRAAQGQQDRGGRIGG